MECNCGGYVREKVLTYERFYQCESCGRVLITDHQKEMNDKASRPRKNLTCEKCGAPCFKDDIDVFICAACDMLQSIDRLQ